MDGAMDEVVADACEMMLRDSEAVQRLAKENRNLAEKIRDWINDFAEKVRAAFAGDRATHAEARAMLDRMDALQRLWDDALVDAAKANAAKENTAGDGGVQHSERKSIGELGSEELRKYEKYANRYWTEMGVKSPFFRAWFGDWRANDNTDVRIASRIGSERGVQHNDDTGWDINISAKVFNETKAHTAKYNRAAVDYLPYMNDIVKSAILLDSKTMDKKKSNNSLLMHSLYAVADIGDGPAVLKLYVEEMVDPNRSGTSKRAYQLQSIEKYQQPDAKGSGKLPSPVIQTADIRTVADLFSYVKQKDKQFHPKPASKVVNEDGTPMVVYHGTSDTFWAFDENEISDLEGSFFFAQNIEDAAGYSGNGRIMPVYVNLQNPVDYNDMPLELYKLKNKKAQVEALKKLGYDGWIADMDTGWGEVSAFYPEQIKSANSNKGTFDSGSPDIRYSEREYSEDEKKQHIADAKRYFGKTYKWAETGYLTPGGTKLDFSGRHEGAPGGYRTVDHRDIRDALGEDYGGEDYSGAMIQFMREGNIRIMPESGGIDLIVKPTQQQEDALVQFVQQNRGAVMLDIDDANGNTIASVEFDRGTRSSTVIGAIRNYFDYGVLPESPDVQYSERDNTRTERDILADATDGDANTVREMEMLREYKEKLGHYTALTRRLEQQRELAQTAESKDERLRAKNRADNLASLRRLDLCRALICTPPLLDHGGQPLYPTPQKVPTSERWRGA